MVGNFSISTEPGSAIDQRCINAGLVKADNQETCIIISSVGDIQVGSVVDEVLEVVGYEEGDIDMQETDRVNHRGDGVCGVAKDSSGDLTLVLDLSRALNHTDFKVLKEQNAA